jgi:hypothetical protein
MKIPFYKLTLENQNFVNYLLNTGIGRSRNVSMALAVSVAKTYAIPATEVDFPEYYDVTYKTSVMTILGIINETFLIDIDETERHVKRFMEARYLVSAPSNTIILASKGTAFLDFIGVGRVFSQEEVQYIQDNYLELNKLLWGFPSLVGEITGVGEQDAAAGDGSE